MRHRYLWLLCTMLSATAVADDVPADASSALSGTSVEVLKVLAEQGDGEARAELGERYAKGRDVPQDFERAAHWRQLAAEQDIAHAQNGLGRQYAAGLGVQQDDDKALALLRRAAGKDVPDYWFDLAVFFEQIGSDEALDAATDWYTRAVAAGHVGAHARLGLMYYNGTGVEQDLARAAVLFAYAAERGHARAQNNLGLMLTQGKGVEQDHEKAVELFRSAADQGLKEAYTNLGVMYENGFGVEFDEARAVSLYRQAALQGTLDGALNQIGFPADPRINMGVPTLEDLKRLLREAELGDAISQYQSGYLLLGTMGVDPDYAAAADLLAEAAGNGIGAAMTNLGLLYFRGLGVPQDYVLGFMWVSLGAAGGREQSVEVRDYLASFLTASQINDAQVMARKFRAGTPVTTP